MANQVGRYDVVVIGGGAAGLSGALLLARSRRSVLVVDAGEPRNAPAAHTHGFLTRDGLAPGALLELGRAEVRGYGGEVVTGRVISAAAELPTPDGGFRVELEDGRTVHGRRLLVTTGVVDELPDVPGVRERWGRDVVHCPYCHGWEVRDQAIGVLASGPLAVHQALLFRQLSSDVMLFRGGLPVLAEEESQRLAARDIRVVEDEVVELVVAEDHLTGVRLRSGEVVPRQVVAVGPRSLPRADDLLGSLGLEVTEHLSGGGYVAADPTGATAVPGVWVAGNVADLMAQVIGAAAGGSRAGAMINADLVTDDVRRALASSAVTA